jgi:L-aspartate oxidase
LNLKNLQALIGMTSACQKLRRFETGSRICTWQNMLPCTADRPSYELNAMITNARLVTEAALLREESRGAHYRTDFPKPLPEWQKHTVFKNA